MRLYVFQINIFRRGIWHVVKLFLDPAVRKKVVLLGGGRQPPGPPAYIVAENMLEEYGGQNTTSYASYAPSTQTTTMKYYMIEFIGSGVLPLLLRFFKYFLKKVKVDAACTPN